MTREEQMWQAVQQEHGKISRREALIALTAMEWSDKTMIDKACEIVRNIANKYFGDWGQSCKVEDTFRKAMEE